MIYQRCQENSKVREEFEDFHFEEVLFHDDLSNRALVSGDIRSRKKLL